MAEAIVSRVAKLLDDFTEDGKSWLFGGEFDKLKKPISAIQNVVHDAEKRSFGDGEIQAWLGDLKAAFYDAEDLLQEWNVEVMPRESLSIYEKLKQQVITSFSPLKQRALWRMRTRARAIRDRIGAIAAKGMDFGSRESAQDVRVERRLRNREWSDSFVYDEEIIGRDDDKREIMKFLLDSDTDDQISVLSIYGERGMGKTSLARCLYKDGMVNKHFDLMMWVSVDDNYSLKEVLLKIIESVTTERADGIEVEQLQNQLMELARGKKYLLVLAGIGSEIFEQWESLKSLLIGGAKGSKILIIARSKSVVRRLGASPSYQLEALSESSSLDLLMRMACQEEEETRDSIKLIIGRRIVKKCRGIPLAIRTIGSILFSMKTAVDWIQLEHEISTFTLHFGDLLSILELAYSYLPCNLKQCFAFCSLFPKNFVIDKQMLTSVWMAEGFIQPIDNLDLDMEDVAHDYFMTLLRRNFLQDCTKDELGRVISCKMHGLMHEVARSVAYPEYDTSRSPELLINERVRHASVRHASWGSSLSWIRRSGEKKLRTLIQIDKMGEKNCWQIQFGEETLCKIISSCKFLRALGWHDGGIEKLSSSVSELKYLTFLDLSENEGIIRLPDSITGLRTLQVLKLNMCYKLIELPRNIRKLVNLRQLEISSCSALSCMPHGLGKLTLLRTLTDFILPGDEAWRKSYGGLGELNSLNKLRGSLKIEVKGEIKDTVAESNAANLKEKNFLVSLILVFPGKESDEILLRELQPSVNLQSLEIRGYGGTRFPSWMSCMPKIVQLRLFDCAGCRSLPSLGELSSLKHLEIGKLPIVEYAESDIHTLPTIPNLSTLRIWECPKLKFPGFPLESLHTSVATIEYVVGIDDQVKDVIKLLEIENDELEVRIVGIHGTNGIGKTTIAKAVYDQLSSYFDTCSFLAEIGQTTRNNGGIQCLQTRLVCDILEQDGDVASFEGGIKFFRDVFHTMKVLIVLDDVEEQSHLHDLVGDQLDWFGPGSRIIVTLENDGILQTYVSGGLAFMHEVHEMNEDRALELFCKHALGTHCSRPGYLEIGKRIVRATGQVPFVIEVIGSFLRGKTIEDWRKIEDLVKPQKENSQEILKDCKEILKICYEALDEKQKQIFWDIACFANGVDSRIASYMWPNQDLLPSHHVLMPLAKIGGDNKLWMHKLLKCLSRTIDQEEPKYPGRHSRQYIHVTNLEVINSKKGMEKVEALCFDLKNHHLHTITEADFESMPNIRFLKLDHASMTGNFANVFLKLRWLHWQGWPRDFDGAEFSLTELVILDLSWSKVTKDWGGWRKIKMEQLKVLNLTGCTDLLISPKFSGFPNLEMLILERCFRLVHLDSSVGGLKKLLCLNLKSCTELNRLPVELGALKALKELLVDETSVRDIPLGGDVKELETLSASNCLSLSYPNGLGELLKLRRLSLRNCHGIRKLPTTIGQSPLEELDISGTGISEFPDSLGNLQGLRVLKMDYSFMSNFPSFIWCLGSLEEMHASSCRNLKGEIPGDIGKLKNLRILRLRNSTISRLPSEIEHLPKLETLDVLYCDMLHELPELPSSLIIVHLSPRLKEKVSKPFDGVLFHH